MDPTIPNIIKTLKMLINIAKMELILGNSIKIIQRVKSNLKSKLAQLLCSNPNLFLKNSEFTGLKSVAYPETNSVSSMLGVKNPVSL